jgi:hypothetical protein
VFDAMAWLEASALGRAMRESGLWTYPIVNLTHILGVASLFGALVVLDLRLLGAWRDAPLAAVSRPTVPVATAGGAIAILSGVCLLATNATEYVGNPFLLVKFPAILLGLVNVGLPTSRPGWKAHRSRALEPRERRQLAAGGAVSLVCWLTAIAAGRMIGYW